MNSPTRNMSPDRPQLRQLDEAAINRIAAGEVVGHPHARNAVTLGQFAECRELFGGEVRLND